jgi:hypothetical protein
MGERGSSFWIARTSIKLAVGNMDCFYQSAKNFHVVENFTGNRKTIAKCTQLNIDFVTL